MALNWEEAKNHLYLMKGMYEEIGPAGSFGLMFMVPMIKRFESGERTKELYDEIMEIE